MTTEVAPSYRRFIDLNSFPGDSGYIIYSTRITLIATPPPKIPPTYGVVVYSEKRLTDIEIDDVIDKIWDNPRFKIIDHPCMWIDKIK